MLDLSITTERLVLRPFQLTDAPRVQTLIGAWEVASMTANIPHPYPDCAADSWIAARATSADHSFAVTLHDDCIGCVGLKAEGCCASTEADPLEIAYWLGKSFWNRGFMTEAARAVAGFAFGLLAQERLVAGHFADNSASGKVLAKLGFRATGRGMHPCVSRGEDVDCIFVALSRDAWRDDTVIGKV